MLLSCSWAACCWPLQVFQIKSTLHIDGQRVLLMTAEETDPLFDANPCYVTDKVHSPPTHTPHGVLPPLSTEPTRLLCMVLWLAVNRAGRARD